MGKRKAKRKAEAQVFSEDPEEATAEAAEAAHALEPSEEEGEGAGDSTAALTPYEIERQRIIQRNRERLMELGIPTLVAKLEKTAEAAKPKKKPAKKKPRGEAALLVKREPGAGEQPVRRSSRIQQQHMSEQERLEFDLGRLMSEGRCPRCHEGVEGEDGQLRAHLGECQGPKRELERGEGERPARVRRTDVEMTEEERRDVRKRTLARMKQLSLENLVDFTDEAAKFVVLGSTGNHYTVTLKDGKHTCECMDYRFRRHHCKHICLALSHLGILDEPTRWHEAVEAKLSELVKAQAGRGAGLPEVQAPRGEEAEVALRLL